MTDAPVRSDTPTASELRHRMANTLQLLSALARMRSQRAGDDEAKRQLAWIADAIGSIGSLEQKRQGSLIDLTAYLHDMVPVWRRRHGAAAEVRIEADTLLAPDNAASTLTLIIQELVGNALTHGFPDGRTGVVVVSLTDGGDGWWEMKVCDDGRGFDPDGPEGKARFGLWLVRSLTAQVRGEFSLTPGGAGVIGSLRFQP